MSKLEGALDNNDGISEDAESDGEESVDSSDSDDELDKEISRLKEIDRRRQVKSKMTIRKLREEVSRLEVEKEDLVEENKVQNNITLTIDNERAKVSSELQRVEEENISYIEQIEHTEREREKQLKEIESKDQEINILRETLQSLTDNRNKELETLSNKLATKKMTIKKLIKQNKILGDKYTLLQRRMEESVEDVRNLREISDADRVKRKDLMAKVNILSKALVNLKQKSHSDLQGALKMLR